MFRSDLKGKVTQIMEAVSENVFDNFLIIIVLVAQHGISAGVFLIGKSINYLQTLRDVNK